MSAEEVTGGQTSCIQAWVTMTRLLLMRVDALARLSSSRQGYALSRLIDLLLQLLSIQWTIFVFF